MPRASHNGREPHLSQTKLPLLPARGAVLVLSHRSTREDLIEARRRIPPGQGWVPAECVAKPCLVGAGGVWRDMINGFGHCRRGARKCGMSKLARSTTLLMLVAALLSSCAAGSTGTEEALPAKTINLAADVLLGIDVADVQRVDADGDGELEWLVFYRFDQVDGRGPVGALIYDVARPSPPLLPVVYPHKLRIPDENYLAQSIPEMSLVDVVSEPQDAARNELVLTTTTEAAFFRLNHDLASQLADEPPMYRCIGFFRSEGGVSLNYETLEVCVTSRAGFERSQLVTRRYYKPEVDGYFVTGTTTLVPAFASKIDFPEGIPPAILDTPYPEKIVLAFYQTLGKKDAEPNTTDYLTTEAAQRFAAGALGYGSPYRTAQLTHAVVKELGYYPTQEGSTSTIVTAKVVFRSESGQQSPLIDVRWSLTRIQNQWKMDHPES